MVIYILLCFFMGFVDTAFKTSYSFINDLIILLYFAYYIIKKNGKLNIKFIFIFCLLILLVHSCYLIFADNLIEALKGGRQITITYLYIIIFYLLIRDNISEKSITYYKKSVFLILKINIIFIMSENVINVIGYNYLINKFIPNYRYLHSYFINSFMNIDFVAPNSLVLGAQSASIISLMGIILFAPFYKGERTSRASFFWLLLAFISYISSITGASIVCLAIYIMIWLYFANISKSKKIVFSGFIIIFCSAVKNAFLYRFPIDTWAEGFVKEYYLEHFLAPLVVWSDFSLIDLLFGVGTGPMVEERLYFNADFGLGVLLVSHGLLIMGFITILYFIYSINIVYILNKEVQHFSEIDSFVIKNYLCTLVLFVSTIHYTTLFMPGMRQFFAFQIALTCVLIMRMKSERLKCQPLLKPNSV